jgi:aspartate aminotransferase
MGGLTKVFSSTIIGSKINCLRFNKTGGSMKISNRAKEIQESPIRKLVGIANETKKKGRHVYHLNIGQPDIHTPDAFYKNINEFADKVLSYGPSDGLPELKEAMIDYFSRYDILLEPANILITCGGSEAISFAFAAIGDAGDEIIIPEPFYTNYNGFATFSQLKVVPVETKAEEGFHLPDMSQIEAKITGKTRAILINSPNNPTGTVFTKDEITGLAELAKKHDLFLLADEVYKEFIYDGKKHFSILELKGMEDHTIVMDSISKRYSACGARIGAVISKNKEVVQSILKFAQARLCPPTLGQIGAIGAYRLPPDYFKKVLAEYQKRRDILFDILTSNKGIILRKPKGAFYIMAKLPIDDSDEFAKWMLGEFDVNGETVMVAPGAGFYSTPGKGKQEVRIAYVLETRKLEIAGKIILEAIKAYHS